MTYMLSTGGFKGDRDDLMDILDGVNINSAKRRPLRAGYEYFIASSGKQDHVIGIYDVQKRKVAGALLLLYFAPKTYTSFKVALLDEYRGEGLGQAMYDIALNTYGFALVSSTAQTANGLRMWQKLAIKDGITVCGMVPIAHMKGSTITKSIKDAVGRHTVREMVEVSGVLDVVKGKLKPVLKAIGAAFYSPKPSYIVFPVELSAGEFTSEHFKMKDNGTTFLYAVSSKGR